jgi:tRNA pseudouridine38-40 synthase
MPNVRLTIAYDGTEYAGWQVQKNARTVQGEIEKALKKILKESPRLIGAGRTDSGVHARRQAANFKTKSTLPLIKLQSALNANLPKDISIVGIKKARRRFHSRFNAKGKVYRYTILNSRIDDPLSRAYYWKIPYALKVPLLRSEARVLLGRHDFKSFQAKSDLSCIKNTVRTVKGISIKKSGRFIYLDIEADGFLRQMIRNIVGTLAEIARGYFAEGSMKRILASRNRRKAGPTAPAKGLTLLKVKYK